MNTDVIDRMVIKWQRILRCQDWTIEVIVSPACDMPEAVAECWRSPNTRWAQIRIADPATMVGSTTRRSFDLEHIVLHEVIHVLIPPDCEDGTCTEAQEQGVDAIALALVTLDRRRK